MAEDPNARHNPCLACSDQATRLDTDPPIVARGKGWAFIKKRILTECPTCKTGPRSRIRIIIELDEGTHQKRTLR